MKHFMAGLLCLLPRVTTCNYHVINIFFITCLGLVCSGVLSPAISYLCHGFLQPFCSELGLNRSLVWVLNS